MQKIPVLIVGGVLVQAYQYYGTLMRGKGKRSATSPRTPTSAAPTSPRPCV